MSGNWIDATGTNLRQKDSKWTRRSESDPLAGQQVIHLEA